MEPITVAFILNAAEQKQINMQRHVEMKVRWIERGTGILGSHVAPKFQAPVPPFEIL